MVSNDFFRSGNGSSVRFCQYYGLIQSFFKDKIYGQHQKGKAYDVVESECFVSENQQTKDHKNCQGYHFLQHLKLNKAKRTSVALISDAVGRHLKHVFEQSNRPTDEYYPCQVELIKTSDILKLEVTIPG